MQGLRWAQALTQGRAAPRASYCGEVGRTHCGLQRHAGGVLGDAVHVAGSGEADVEADGLWALRLAVAVRLEALLEEARGIPLLLPTPTRSAQ